MTERYFHNQLQKSVLKAINRIFNMALCVSFAFCGFSGSVNANAPAPMSYQTIEKQLTMLEENAQPFTVNVYFDTDSSVIRPEYQTMLADIITLVAQKDSFQFEISITGHTDERASNEYNQALGLRRAEAVKAILLPWLGKRFTITSLISEGEENPLADNDSYQGKAINRHVEINIFRPFVADSFARDNKAISLSSQGGNLLVSSEQGLVLWNTLAQCPQNLLPEETDKIYASAVSESGRLALSGGSNKILTLWDVATATPLANLAGHQQAITAVAFSKSAMNAITGSIDHQIKFWDLSEKKLLATFAKHRAPITVVAIASNGKLAASADSSGKIIVWNLVTHTQVTSSQPHNGQVTALRFTDDSNTLISSSRDQRIHLWQLKADKHDYLSTAINSPVTAFALSADNKRVLASYENGHIIEWSLATFQETLHLTHPESSFIAVSYLHDDMVMASDSQHNIHLWDGRDGRYIEHFATQGRQVDTGFPEPVDVNQTQSWHDPLTNMEFSWIPPACYEMGCGSWNQQCSASDQPTHQVCNPGYWIAQNEVSQQQWVKLMGYNPSKQVDCADGECLQTAVNQVSWLDSQLYLCKLNRQTGRFYRLPSEAEWEYACRDGGQKVRYSNSTGDDFMTAPFNLVNMNKGVWEWTLDSFSDDDYTKHVRYKPVSTGDNNYHFMQGNVYRSKRGGAWSRGAEKAQCAVRHYDEPQSRTFYTGFRLVKP